MHDMNLLPIYQNLKDLTRKGSMNSQFEDASKRNSMNGGVRAEYLQESTLGFKDLE